MKDRHRINVFRQTTIPTHISYVKGTFSQFLFLDFELNFKGFYWGQHSVLG